MKLKAVPMYFILILGVSKFSFVLATKDLLDAFGWALISLGFLQITWAYWKDKKWIPGGYTKGGVPEAVMDFSHKPPVTILRLTGENK
jgi:hypothetical protein